MGNQVKPVRCLLAGIGHGWLHCIGHVLSPNAPCRTLGEVRIRDPEIILKVALEWGNLGTQYLTPVGQGVPQVPPVWVPLLQITSVASMANAAVSMASQQSGTSATSQPQQQTEQCRKCGKKNHPTSHCCQKVTCRKCKGEDHITKFCSTPNQEELKCTFCGKTKHSMENCKARKEAEKKIQKELKAKRTSTVTSTAASTTSSRTPPLSQAQPSQTHQQAPVTHKTMQQVPLQAAGMEERLQCLTNRVNQLTSGLLPPSPPPPAYTSAWSEDGQWSYSTAGSMHLIPTSAPGMCRQNNNQRSHVPNGTPSTASGTSLKSHMTEISKTMLQLAQAHERIINTQQNNHQTMVNVQQQQANTFKALAVTTQQQK